MTLRPVWIVAFSGHRPNSEIGRSQADLQACRQQIQLALQEFQKKAQALDGDIELLTSAAEGADQVAIEVAESLGLALHIILPLPISEFAQDFHNRRQAWDLALAAIAKSGGLVDRDERFVAALCEFGLQRFKAGDWPPLAKPGWTFRVSDGTHERDDCYLDCDTQMLDAADGLIVVRNQREQAVLGGTIDVIDQAKARGIAIAVVDSTNQQLARVEWMAKPWAIDTVVKEMDLTSGKSKPTSRLSATSEPIEKVFASLDGVANRMGGRLKNRVTTIIALQFTATIIAAINSALLLPKLPTDYHGIEFRWDATLIAYQVLFGCEFVLVGLAFLLGLSSRWTNLKKKWRQTRFGAEILRSLIHTRGLVDPLYPIVSGHDPVWHRFALSCGLSTLRDNHAKVVDWAVVKANYQRDRIDHQREAYYRKQLVGASKLSKVCGNVAILAGTLAPICLIFAIYLKIAHADWVTNSVWSPVFITFLPILLPLLAGTAGSLKVVTDAGRRAERYKMQADRLHALSNWFPTLRTPSSIRRAVVLTEEILLDELIEWHAASKNTGK